MKTDIRTKLVKEELRIFALSTFYFFRWEISEKVVCIGTIKYNKRDKEWAYYITDGVYSLDSETLKFIVKELDERNKK